MKFLALLTVAALNIFSPHAAPAASDPGSFPHLCRQLLAQKGLKAGLQADICNQVEHENFNGAEAVQELQPGRLEVNPDEVDKRVRYVTFYRAGHLSRLGYCYAVFKKWFDPKQIDSATLPLLSTGFSISKADLSGYPEWLNGTAGAACRKSVESKLGSPVMDLASEMKDKDMLIALNPLGAMKNAATPPAVKRELQNSIVHSRILALHVTCPSFATWADDHWSKLPKDKKSALMSAYPEYNWSDPVVASRESVAYEFESKPTDLAPHRTDCKY